MRTGRPCIGTTVVFFEESVCFDEQGGGEFLGSIENSVCISGWTSRI